MFPWNYGFHFGIASYIFLGAFYTVLVVVATTLLNAFWRAHRDLQQGQGGRHPLALGLSRSAGRRPHLPARPDRRVQEPRMSERLRLPRVRDARQTGRAASAGGCAGTEDEIFGMSFPLDRMYHRGHTWARPETDGTVTVGLDDLGARLLGTPDAVDLPGARIARTGQRHGVPHPPARSRCPRPLAGGWRSGRDRRRRSRVLPAREAARRRDRYAPSAARRRSEALDDARAGAPATRPHHGRRVRTPSLADGGVPVADIAAAYPKTDWDAVCGEMFLEP